MSSRLSARHPQGGEYRIMVRGHIGAASPAFARCLFGALDDLRSRQVELISVLPAA